MTVETALDTLRRTVASLPDSAATLVAATVIVLAAAMLLGHMVPPLPGTRTKENQ